MLKKLGRSIRRKFQSVFPQSGAGKDSLQEREVKQVQEVVAVPASSSASTSSPALSPSPAPVAPVEEVVRKKPQPKRKPPWTLDKFVVPELEEKKRFHDFAIPLPLMHGIADLKFEYCTPIQEQSLEAVLAGKDLIGKANTGTGKTAVFLVGVMARLLADKKGGLGKRTPRALILAPTRELVMQIVKDAKKLGRYTGVNADAVYGGAEYEKQMELLKRGKTDIVVATPGRLIDFHNKRLVNFDNCQTLVIDEADRMLDMGFIPDVRRIVSWMPKKRDRQTLMFSATISSDVNNLSAQWCVDPEVVEAEADQVTTDTVEQKVYLVTAEEKYNVLYNLIKENSDERIMIFANMKSETRKLADRLKRNSIDCLLLSGDVPQNKRQSRLESFRTGKVKVLVATDVAGRGIHIDGISYVVNYTLPYEPEDYVHRIGRTGRAGLAGKSVSFACEEGSFYLPDIEEYIGAKLDCVLPPEELLVHAPKGTAPVAVAHKKYKPRKKTS
ncbi:DEAD/DEAH box helicase [Desulfotalea psychrophila]|uniref:Related to ATP-dependent RNA helicase (RhlE) n=1 Tax=Desulfotalea psychrophila (strain LSv54 / DSM 12343) TaxID=177439 RepID=Q6APU7_DESPS|nr:DEAD/DEAH box helicase [Desulfotalea psychrophila]CAG35627.1 related to ATP-dependent RNA helicase (RhlE) [Desulfotalea psychrophila LSv54]